MDRKKDLQKIIIKLIILVAIITSLTVILVALFKGIVIGRTETKELIYSQKNLVFIKILVITSLIGLVSIILNTIITYIKKIDLPIIKLIEIIIYTFVLITSISSFIIFPVEQDKRNYYAYSFSIANMIILITLISVNLYQMLNKEEPQKLTIQVISEGSILAALSIVLSLISKIIPGLEMPNGGSFSLSMLPLFIFSLRRGPKAGFIMGLVYSFANMVTDGFVFIHIGVPFFDYILPFSLLAGVSGLFSKKAQEGRYSAVILAVIIGASIRYVFHSLSGVIFFAEYAGTNNVWLYSFILYNLPYMLVSTIGTLIIIPFLSKQFIFTETRIK